MAGAWPSGLPSGQPAVGPILSSPVPTDATGPEGEGGDRCPVLIWSSCWTEGYGRARAQRSQLGGSAVPRPLTKNTPTPGFVFRPRW